MSEACKVIGYSRDTFYRYKELYENGGEEALHEISKKKPLVANRVSEDMGRAVVNIATEFPAYGQQRAANVLYELLFIIISLYAKISYISLLLLNLHTN